MAGPPIGTDGSTLRRSVLPGGLRVVTEAVPAARSVAVGVWVGVGSRDESAALAGVSHYLEHLLFKGTSRRGALEIAAALDAVGGESNAFTDREHTCFYARVQAADLPLAVDVTCDMVLSSVLRTEDVEAERGVVLEEIALHDDTPDDVVHDLFAEALYGDHPLGRPVLGTSESIARVSRASIAGFYRRRYTPRAMVVAVAGGLDHDVVVALVQAAFEDRLEPGDSPARRRPAGRGPVGLTGIVSEDRDGEQAHLVLGTTGVRRDDPRRPALSVLSGALGGGMSSRLFQSVREQRGLAYSVYSWASSGADSGELAVYAGCSPAKVDEVLGLVRSELDDVAEHGLTEAEVTRARGQLQGSTALGLEDTGARMTRIGKAELTSGEVLTVDEVLGRIAAVTVEDVREVAAQVLSGPLALAVVGPVEADLSDAVA